MMTLPAAILLGLAAGMVVNYLADVLPWTRRFTAPPLCVYCQHKTPWQRYLSFRACQECGRRRSVRTWVVLLVSTAVFAWLWAQPHERLGFWAAGGLLTYLLLVAVIDLEHRVILNPVSVLGGAIGVLVGLTLHGSLQTLLGGLAGFAFMLLLYFGGELFARWMAKLRKQEIDEVALGFGDVYLSGILGLILGWPGIVAGLVFGILFGGVAGMVYILVAKLSGRYQMFSAIPYAPFLILGAVVLLFRPG